MVRNSRNGTLLLVGLTLGCLVTSCLPEESYEACGFPPEEKARCQGDDKTLNCLIEHPTCPDNYCISWQGSDSFCSEKCKKSSDCPENGCCVPFILGCTDPADPTTCPSLCVDRTKVKDGICPASELPPTETNIDIPEPDLAAIVEDTVSAD